MRELSFDELQYVAGGGQQTSDEGPIVVGGGGGDGGGDGTGGTGTGSGSPQEYNDSELARPTRDSLQAVLQQFLGELSFTEAQHNEYTGSGYDHDAGADYAPYPGGYLEVPTHDPAANAPYWSTWDGDTDPEFLQAIAAYQLTHGIVSVAGKPETHAVALQLGDQNHLSVFVDGQYFRGTYHPGNAPGDISGQPENEITVQGIHDGYWTFELDTSGLVQSSLNAGGLGSATNFTGAGYVTPGASTDANHYATTHIKVTSTDAHAAEVYQRVHDDLAKAYDLAVSQIANPGLEALFGYDIGGGRIAHATDLLQRLEKTVYKITDEPAGKAGAHSWNDQNSGLVYINPGRQYENSSTYKGWVPTSGIGAIDYAVFHELGHGLNWDNADETFANHAYQSIMEYLGMPLIIHGAIKY